MGNNLFFDLLYLIIGIIISYLFKPYLALPWYLTSRQYLGVVLGAFGLLFSFLALHTLDILFIIHKIPADNLVVIGKGALFFIGYMLPFYLYKKRLEKKLEYRITLAKKLALVPGWELPPGDEHD
jgi:hypothetical protein